MPDQPVQAGVLFDLDGTLLDHTAAAVAAVRSWVAELAPERAPQAAVPDLWLRLEREHFGSFLAGRCSFAEQRRRRARTFLAELGLLPERVDEAYLDERFTAYLRHYEASWRRYPDVVDTLAALRAGGATLGVLTNGDETQQRRKLARVGLGGAFDEVVASSRLGVAKPEEEAFQRACARLGCAPADTWYIGDDLRLDYLAAARAGLRAVWLDRDPAWEPVATGVRRVDRLTRLPALLGRATHGGAECRRPADWARQLAWFADTVGAAATWALTGSAALAVYGAPVAPRDVDVVTDRTGLAAILARTGPHLAAGPLRTADVRAAARLHLRSGESAVEVLVDVRHRRPDRSWSEPSEPREAVAVRWHGRLLPVLPLSLLHRVARDRGRTEQVAAVAALLHRFGIDGQLPVGT